MKIININILLTLILMAGLIKAEQNSTLTKNKPKIFVSFYPLKYFTEAIAGDLVEIYYPLENSDKTGESPDPIYWQPKREQLVEIVKSDLIIINGMKFEKWVDTANLPESKVINTSYSLEKNPIYYKHKIVHSHGSGENTTHSHEGMDGHTWLDPENAILQSREILNSIIKLLQKERKKLLQNFANLEQQLKSINNEFVEVTKKIGSQTLLASHPAYNYLARRYNWNIKNFDFDPEEDLSAKQISEVSKTMENLKNQKIKIILWESEPSSENKKLLLEKFNIKSMTFSPVETENKLSYEENFITIMQKNIDRLKQEL